MRRISLALIAVAGIVASAFSFGTQSAFAIDTNHRPTTAYNWTGFYGGLNVGWVHDNYNWAYANPAPATCCAPFSASTDGLALGGHGGVQVQWNHIVLGVEVAVISPTGKSASQLGCIAGTNQTCQASRDTTYTVGGRLGWAWDNWLLFGGGGGAWTNMHSQLNNASAVFDNANSNNKGWYAGGGAEYVLSKGRLVDLIVGLEYQHIDLGKQLQPSSADGFFSSPPGVNGRNVGLTEDLVRLRVSLKGNPFGWK